MTQRTFRLVLGTVGIAAAFCLSWVGDARAHGDVGTMLQKMDTNGDGKISAEEHAAGARAMFQEMDTNGDGKVSPAEMDAYHARTEAMSTKPEKAGKAMELTSAEKIKVMDTNGDGMLSADEHAAGARLMFDKMDTNHDGFLTKAELQAGHDHMMTKTPKS